MPNATYPLLAGQDQLALRALGVPAVIGLTGEGETAEGNAGVDDTTLEDIWVRASEDAGHHRAGRRADSEDAVRVNTPVADRKPRSIGDRE